LASRIDNSMMHSSNADDRGRPMLHISTHEICGHHVTTFSPDIAIA
jgi:hypothetical protein